MFNTIYASPTVTNCTFSGNNATHDGGGMFNDMFSSPVVINCTFSGNNATHDGGGMCTDMFSKIGRASCRERV